MKYHLGNRLKRTNRQHLFAIALIFGGLSLLLGRIITKPQPLTQISTTPITFSVTRPDESPVSIDARYNVPANQPRRILIPTIGVSGFVQPVGVDQHGAIAAPNNVNLAGWFTGKAAPGEPGLSIIDGHVNGFRKPGIFKRLVELKPGDQFEVEMGDLTRRKFEVIDTISVEAKDADTQLYKQSIDTQLNLITCTGEYDRTHQQYAKRHIVYAKYLKGV